MLPSLILCGIAGIISGIIYLVRYFQNGNRGWFSDADPSEDAEIANISSSELDMGKDRIHYKISVVYTDGFFYNTVDEDFPYTAYSDEHKKELVAQANKAHQKALKKYLKAPEKIKKTLSL